MIDLRLVGIGTGNPEHLTLEGRAALREAALVLLPRKGLGKSDLAERRREILAAMGSAAEVAEFDMPVRDDALPYDERVEKWHDEIAAIWAERIAARRPDGPVALMVWGDPGLYDSTLRIAERLNPKPQVKVVPGVSALQALTAAHAIPFNAINGAVVITTGRRLRDHGWPKGADTVAVMLDGQCSFQSLPPEDVEIWWGGFLGMEEQVLVRGSLAEATPRILAARAEARARHGWIMDTYLMRRG
ncbi:MAG: precorrin-6A synthase (deacetylating) [Pseudomonadota bacterium]